MKKTDMIWLMVTIICIIAILYLFFTHLDIAIVLLILYFFFSSPSGLDRWKKIHGMK